MIINDGHVTEVNGGSLWPYHVVSLDIAISRYGACVEDVMRLAHACVEDVHFLSRRCKYHGPAISRPHIRGVGVVSCIGPVPWYRRSVMDTNQ